MPEEQTGAAADRAERREERAEERAASTGGVWSFGYKVLGMPAEQQRGALFALVLIFGAYVFWDDRQAARQAENDRTATLARAVESVGTRVEQSNDKLAATNKELLVEVGSLRAQVADGNATARELKQ